MKDTKWYAAIGPGYAGALVWGYGQSPEDARSDAIQWNVPQEHLTVVQISEAQVLQIEAGEIYASSILN